MWRISRHAALVCFAVVSSSWTALVQAQELEPRAYSPNPVGLHFAAVGLAESSGDVLFDPAIPITDVNARLRAGIAAYGQTFGILNRSAIVTLAVPYVTGSVSGAVGEGTRKVHRSGLADT